MAAVLSPTSSTASSPRPAQPLSSPNAALSSLPPINTSAPAKRSVSQRPPSFAAKNRLSSYSSTSNPPPRPSRPPSHVFPLLKSSLSYSLVRDFAYPVTNHMHFGPPPEPSPAPSGQSTPAHELSHRLSEASNDAWDYSKGWEGGQLNSDGSTGTEQLPQLAYTDDHDHGPPYSEDEDLQSPVVVSARHKKRSRQHSEGYFADGRGTFAGTNGDGTETYYIRDEDEMADGPGGELVTYPTNHSRHQRLNSASAFNEALEREYGEPSDLESPFDNANLQAGSYYDDQNRYSRDYQFTIASPDEEMHGKAVALFDFQKENENELPLMEGQVILVSYRHGHGWLVAEDPRTGDTGLVPEEYVRLLRDIEGGWSSLSGTIDGAMDNNSSSSGQRDQLGMLSPGSLESQSDPLANAGSDLPTRASDSKSQAPDISNGSSNTTNTTNTATTRAAPSSSSTASNSSFSHHFPPTSSSTSSSHNNTLNPATTAGITSPTITTMSSGKRPSIVSTFSTSTKDFDPYPHALLGTQAGQQPPQLVHRASQSTTPTTATHSPALGSTMGAGTGNSSNRKGSYEDEGGYVQWRGSRKEGRR
ncbi:HOG (high osmolarity glycerol) pathway protein [Agyrium rufum]|nr:HOG (high osmolarity glycerol) pathway protein [Agyrium rufum]